MNSQTVTVNELVFVAASVPTTWSVRWVNVSSVQADVGCEPPHLVYTAM